MLEGKAGFTRVESLTVWMKEENLCNNDDGKWEIYMDIKWLDSLVFVFENY